MSRELTWQLRSRRLDLTMRRLSSFHSQTERLLFDESVHDRRLRRRLLATKEHIVQTAGADPDHLAVAPELLSQYAHALRDPLLDRVGFHAELALRGEDGPVGFLSGILGLAIGDQILRHRINLLS